MRIPTSSVVVGLNTRGPSNPVESDEGERVIHYPFAYALALGAVDIVHSQGGLTDEVKAAIEAEALKHADISGPQISVIWPQQESESSLSIPRAIVLALQGGFPAPAVADVRSIPTVGDIIKERAAVWRQSESARMARVRAVLLTTTALGSGRVVSYPVPGPVQSVSYISGLALMSVGTVMSEAFGDEDDLTSIHYHEPEAGIGIGFSPVFEDASVDVEMVVRFVSQVEVGGSRITSLLPTGRRLAWPPADRITRTTKG